ncbi:MAG: DUF481 domain-containing protein [Candidatus Latescibacteria bacterium]|nr:DUF481 domain-containing protein [Candidatus Latescibacterota bacterium]
MLRPASLLLACAALLLGVLPGHGQILNTLTGFSDEKPGWSGGLGVGLSASGGNVEELELSGAGRVQLRTGPHRFRFLTDGARKSADESTIEERFSIHLRHNLQVTGRLHSLEFAQVQQNRFQRLRERWLLGLGARIDLLSRPAPALSIGAAEMLEIERIEDEPERETRHRLSTFVTFEAGDPKKVSVSLTGFAQPLWEDFGDLRAIAQGSIRSAVTGWLALVTAAELSYDAEPPARVETTDWSLESGLTVSF